MIDYNKIINKHVQAIQLSKIRKYFDLAAKMDNVISLGVGEPDFMTPLHIRQAGIKAINDGTTRYTDNLGLSELRLAFSDYLKRRFEIYYDPQTEIIATVGGSEGIDMSLRLLIDSGDEILIPEPSYVCYDPITRLSGGKVVALPTKREDNFKITPELLRSKISDKTKVLILSYPNNPTGAIMDKADLEAIAPIIIEHNLIVISDEIYAELNYTDTKHFSIVNLDHMAERTILIGGLSKAYSMTGWRLGFVCGPKEIIKEMIKIHQYTIMCAPTISQYAGIEALNNGDDDVQQFKDEFSTRRRIITDGFNRLGLSCYEPQGAFYVFPCIQSTELTSDEFCEQLLYDQQVAVVPGNAFGPSGEGHIRVSYCYSIHHIEEALCRIEQFLIKLKAIKK